MKNFRKNKEGLFICKECEREFITRQGIGNHIGRKHNSKQYYNKWLRSKDEGICKICKKKTIFRAFKYGYANCCSKKCSIKYTYKQTKKGNLKKFKVENPYQRKDIREKIKQTNLERYGVENAFESNEIKNKIKKTKLERYGNENYINIEKIKQTNLERYGVENPMQNKDIFEKSFKTRIKLKKYKDTNLYYQGSFEKNFLDNYYGKIDIENGLSIKYKYKRKNKVYHSDFYISLLNLIIEIKSTYILLLDKEFKQKKIYTIKQGFNYIMILDKNYKEFNFLFAKRNSHCCCN